MKSRFIQSGIAVAALLTATAAAQAADLPAPSYKAPAYTAPYAYSWSGLYVGISGGYGFGEAEFTVPAVTVEPEGAVLGGTLGYNLQTGSWVWGIEGDFSWADLSDSIACPGGTCSASLNWLGTARGRIGYAGWTNFLPYITGGAAFGEVEIVAPAGTVTDTAVGWTIGAGLEYALFTNWSVKAEYLYIDLGDIDAVGANEVSFTSHLVRAGLNYRF